MSCGYGFFWGTPLNNRLGRTMFAFACLAITGSAFTGVVAPSHADAVEGQALNGLALLSELVLRAEGGPAYSQDYFEHWLDDDRDCLDTRQEVLIDESVTPVVMADACTIASGEWYSPWDGRTSITPVEIDVVHFVPLQEAWFSGASSWDSSTRQRFANDLDLDASLTGMMGSLNASRGASDPYEWLPSLADTRCQYVSEWVRVKYRWGLTVDSREQAQLRYFLSGACESYVMAVPPLAVTASEAPQETLWPLFKNSYDGTIYEFVTYKDGSSGPVPLNFAKWRDVYGFQRPARTPTDYVGYAWSSSVYAVTFWPGGENAWQWDMLNYNQFRAAGSPGKRNIGWIPGSSFYRWETSSEIFVQAPDATKHALNYAEWQRSGFQPFQPIYDQGFVKLSWSSDIGRMTSLSAGQGSGLSYNEWRGEGQPTPRSQARVNGDVFYQLYGNPTIYYSGPFLNRAVNYNQWAAAGFPKPEIRGAPPVYPFTDVKATATSVVLYGDSQLDGDSWSEQGARAMGFTDQAAHLSFGGIGYSTPTSSAGGTGWTAVQQGLVRFPGGTPGLVLVSMGGNDASAGRSDAQVIADSSALWAKLKLMYPQSKIVINGVMSRNDASHFQRRHIDGVLAANAAKQGVTFISVAGLASTANAQYLDNVHLSQAGHDAVAPLYTAKLRATLGR
ncbi:lysophospholipase L1-like esterase [Arthrobacter sp. PL16]|uniref:GDSL-type esterase/lipase family protein n=1 Tax=Arthrobacter sp. PL16 TaxID=3071720 RepID=UPI002E089010|nr:lysophospholipase L1-like esterase [Arthrobacter sp. PL16]